MMRTTADSTRIDASTDAREDRDNTMSAVARGNERQTELLDGGHIQWRKTCPQGRIDAPGYLEVPMQEPRIGKHRGRFDAEHRREPRQRAARSNKRRGATDDRALHRQVVARTQRLAHA